MMEKFARSSWVNLWAKLVELADHHFTYGEESETTSYSSEQILLRGEQDHSCDGVEIFSAVMEGVVQESYVASVGRIEGARIW
jgi:hypothetical protein